VLHGSGRFVSANVLEVMGASGSQRIRSINASIAAGPNRCACRDYRRIREFSTPPTRSSCRSPPRFAGGGGGIIGLELACVFDALGRRVSVVELTPQLMPGTDRTWCARSSAHTRALPADPAGTSVAGIEPSPPGCA